MCKRREKETRDIWRDRHVKREDRQTCEERRETDM